MADLIDQLIAKLERQGIAAHQQPDGSWRFERAGEVRIVPPLDTFADWMELRRTLREMGVELPD
jgi:hypothetical protein